MQEHKIDENKRRLHPLNSEHAQTMPNFNSQGDEGPYDIPMRRSREMEALPNSDDDYDEPLPSGKFHAFTSKSTDNLIHSRVRENDSFK